MTESMFWSDFWDEKSQGGTDFQATGRGQMDTIGFLHTLREVACILKLNPSDTLLDIGCGTGMMALAMSAFVQRVHAVDLSPNMISRAKDNLAGVANVSAEIGSLRETRQASASYSKILAYSVLQYLASEEQVAEALQEIARVLLPGGRALLAANPNPDKLPAHRDWINGWKDTAARDREFELLDKTIWVLPQTLIDLAAQAGLQATAEPINTRILQHFYMFDLVVRKHG